jgi:DinB family protein
MEITTIKPFFDYYDKVRERTVNVIRVVPPDKLDWAYMPGKFTVGDLNRHIAAIERYMFAETIARRKSAYHGCGRELADGCERWKKPAR